MEREVTVMDDCVACPRQCQCTCDDDRCDLGTSVYRADYIEKDCSKPKVVKPESNLGLVKDPFTQTTIYRNEFKEKTPCSNRYRRPVNYKMNECPFNHQSVYQKDFTEKVTPKSKPFSLSGNIIFPKDPFANKTVYRDEFVNALADKPQLRIPRDNLKHGGVFDSMTNYRENYVQHMGKKPDYVIPSDNLHPEGNYSHTTLYRSDFTPKILDKRTKCHVARDNLRPGCNGLFGKRCYCSCPKRLPIQVKFGEPKEAPIEQHPCDCLNNKGVNIGESNNVQRKINTCRENINKMIC